MLIHHNIRYVRVNSTYKNVYDLKT